MGYWGLGIEDWAQSPIPNPQSPIPNPQSPIKLYMTTIGFITIKYIIINNLFIKNEIYQKYYINEDNI